MMQRKNTYNGFRFTPRRRTRVVQRRSKDEGNAGTACINGSQLIVVVQKNRYESLHYPNGRRHAVLITPSWSAKIVTVYERGLNGCDMLYLMNTGFPASVRT